MFLSLALVNCATLSPSPQDAKLLTMYATIKLANASGYPFDRAQRLISIAEMGRKLLDVNRLPLSQVEELIRKEINWDKLSPEDQLLGEALINRIKSNYTEDPLIDVSETRATASQVLGWVIDGASLIRR